MTRSILIFAAGGLVLAVAACASPPSRSSTSSTSSIPPPSSTPPPSLTASAGSPPSAALSVSQAAAAYVRIVDPGNRILDAMTSDASDAVPFARFAADGRAWIRELHREAAALAAVRWPARVAPYIAAMVATDYPAQVRCTAVLIRAGSYTAMTAASDTNADCLAAARSANGDTVRSLLGLPVRQ